MKYLLIVAAIIILGGFYFINQSNKETTEQIKQDQIALEKRLAQEKAEELTKQYGGSEIKQETITQVVNAKLDDAPAINPEQVKEFNTIISEWMDTSTVAASTGRIALSQPVSQLQEIKRNLSDKKYQGCVESTRLLYLDAMNTNIDSYIEFMKGKEHELKAYSLTVDYQKQLEMAEREKESCSLMTV